MKIITIALLCLVPYVWLAWPLVHYGPYNSDEGWYLYDSYLTWQGQIPYQDFAFPQPPMVLLVHGFFQAMWGPSFYLGRIVNMVLGALIIFLTSWLAGRLGGTVAAFFAGLMLAASPWFAVHMVSVSTYALAALGLVLLIFASLTQKTSLASGIAVLVCWTRLPLFIFASLVPFLSFTYKRHVKWHMPVVTIFFVLAFFIVPFFVPKGADPWLHIVGYHTYSRAGLLSLPSSPEPIIKATWNWLLFERHEYWPTYGIYWFLAFLGLVNMRTDLDRRRLGIILGVAVIVAAGQSLAQNVTYDVPLLPLLAVVSGISWARLLAGWRLPSAYTCLVLIGLCLPVLLYQLHFNAYEGLGESEVSHADIRRVADYISQHSTSTDLIMTPELYIALEAQRAALPGMELGRFFYLPDISEREARQRLGLTPGMFKDLVVSRQAKFIVLSTAHSWERAPQGKQQYADEVERPLLSSGYTVVPDLHMVEPRIESLAVYERQ